jgi:hypothetical protein
VNIEGQNYAPESMLPGEKHLILPGPVTPLENGSVAVTS